MKSCLICGELTKKGTDRNGQIYHICQNCGFTFLDRSSLLSEEKEKARYELHNNDGKDLGYRDWLNSFMKEAVLPFADKGCRILDFGSGPSPVLAELMRESGYRVEIFDKYFAPHFPEGSFDMITSTEVFEHLDDPVALFHKLVVTLSPWGHIALKSSFRPYKNSDFFRWWYREDCTHISFFTERALRILANNEAMVPQYTDSHSVMVFKKVI